MSEPQAEYVTNPPLSNPRRSNCCQGCGYVFGRIEYHNGIARLVVIGEDANVLVEIIDGYLTCGRCGEKTRWLPSARAIDNLINQVLANRKKYGKQLSDI